MEMKHGSHIAALQLFLVVSAAEESQNHAVSSQRGLNNIRNVFFLGLIVEVAHILAGYVLMLGQVVIGTVSDAPQFAPTKREQELDIGGTFAVEAELLGRMVAEHASHRL